MTRKYVQIYDPKVDRFARIDDESGKIVAHKKTKGPYKDLPLLPQKGEDGRLWFNLGNGAEVTLSTFELPIQLEVWASKP